MVKTLEAQDNHHLIASDRVEGTAVYHVDGEKLGVIRNFLVDKKSGRAEFAIMDFGGLFGIGTDHYPLPWKLLAYDSEKGGYVIDIDRSILAKAPRHSAARPEYDRDFDDMVRAYYDGRPAAFI